MDGCPDLLVPDDSSIAPLMCKDVQFGDHATLRSNFRAALALPGINDQLPIVVKMDKVSGECVGGTSAADSETQTAGLSLAIDTAQQPTYVAAHEMGLVLGLGEDVNCGTPDMPGTDAPRLMCAESAYENSTNLPIECATARKQAALFVQQQWGNTVTP
jgi:hypothetical protein